MIVVICIIDNSYSAGALSDSFSVASPTKYCSINIPPTHPPRFVSNLLAPCPTTKTATVPVTQTPTALVTGIPTVLVIGIPTVLATGIPTVLVTRTPMAPAAATPTVVVPNRRPPTTPTVVPSRRSPTLRTSQLVTGPVTTMMRTAVAAGQDTVPAPAIRMETTMDPAKATISPAEMGVTIVMVHPARAITETIIMVPLAGAITEATITMVPPARAITETIIMVPPAGAITEATTTTTTTTVSPAEAIPTMDFSGTES